MNALIHLLAKEKRYDEAISIVKQAQVDDPRNEEYEGMLGGIEAAKLFDGREKDLRAKLDKQPYDVGLNLQLARVLQDEGKYAEVDSRLRSAAGMTNWTHEAMAEVVQYYVDKVHNTDAAIAFLETRAAIDPTEAKLIYSLAALHATQDHADAALKYLSQAAATGGSNVLTSASIDPRFAGLHDDPRFQALLSVPGTNAAPATAGPAGKISSAPEPPLSPQVNKPAMIPPPGTHLTKPVKK